MAACVRKLKTIMQEEEHEDELKVKKTKNTKAGKSNKTITGKSDKTIIAGKSTKAIAGMSILGSKKISSATPSTRKRESINFKSPKMKRSVQDGTLGILMTGLESEQRQIILSSYASITEPRAAVILERYDPVRVSHIITGTTILLSKDDKPSSSYHLCPRTLKYLRGVLDGKFVVRYEWYLESLTSGRWLPEHAFLVDGDQVLGRPTGAVARSLEAHSGERSSPRLLFESMKFHISSSNGAPKELAELIKAGGGVVLPKRQQQQRGSGVNTINIVSDETTPQDQDCRPWTWLMDCISKYSID